MSLTFLVKKERFSFEENSNKCADAFTTIFYR